MTRTMYDGITVLALPDGADLYAGYDDGHWPDADAIAQRFPGRLVLRCTTDPADNEGDVLDVEKGDARPTDIPSWLLRRRAVGVVASIYCSTAIWPTCKLIVAKAGVPQPPWWIARWGIVPTVPIPGSIATQYQSNPGYDVSVVADYWPGVDPAPVVNPPTDIQESDTMGVGIATGLLAVAGVTTDGHAVVCTVPVADRARASAWSIVDLTDAGTAQGVSGLTFEP